MMEQEPEFYKTVMDQIFNRTRPAVVAGEDDTGGDESNSGQFKIENYRTILLEKLRIDKAKVEMSDVEIGRGSFSTVFEGNYSKGTKVAIKQMKTSTTDEAIKNELLVLSYLGAHPLIVTTYGFYQTNFLFHIVMECAIGSLKYIVFDWPSADQYILRQVLYWSADMVEVLRFMKSKGICHRDLKCDNFLVFDKLKLKLADFGFAKKEDDSNWNNATNSLSTSFVGTPSHMASELLFGGSDLNWYSADVYSLGMTMLEMVTRSSPNKWISKDPAEWVLAIITGGDDDKPIQQFKDLILQCIDRIVSKRPTIEEIGATIEEIGANVDLLITPSVITLATDITVTPQPVEPTTQTYSKVTEALKTLLQPVNITPLINRKCMLFVDGLRKWLFDYIYSWIDERDVKAKRMLWVQAGPGMGKTVFASKLSDKLKCDDKLLGVMLFNFYDTHASNPLVVLKTLLHQIVDKYDTVADWLLEQLQQNPGDTLEHIYDEFFIGILNKMKELQLIDPQRSLVIVLDALDEAGLEQSVLRKDLLKLFSGGNLRRLPSWVRLIVTGRPERDLEKALQQYAIVIDENDPRHRDDLNVYIRHELQVMCNEKALHLSEATMNLVSTHVLRASEGKFIYLSLAREQIEEKLDQICMATNVVEILDAILNDLPVGIDECYKKSFEKIYNHIPLRSVRMLLMCVVASPEPMQTSLAVRLVGLDAASCKLEWELLLSSLKQMFPTHQTLVDISRKDAFSRITDINYIIVDTQVDNIIKLHQQYGITVDVNFVRHHPKINALSEPQKRHLNDVLCHKFPSSPQPRSYVHPYHKSVVDWLISAERSGAYCVSISESMQFMALKLMSAFNILYEDQPILETTKMSKIDSCSIDADILKRVHEDPILLHGLRNLTYYLINCASHSNLWLTMAHFLWTNFDWLQISTTLFEPYALAKQLTDQLSKIENDKNSVKHDLEALLWMMRFISTASDGRSINWSTEIAVQINMRFKSSNSIQLKALYTAALNYTRRYGGWEYIDGPVTYPESMLHSVFQMSGECMHVTRDGLVLAFLVPNIFVYNIDQTTREIVGTKNKQIRFIDDHRFACLGNCSIEVFNRMDMSLEFTLEGHTSKVLDVIRISKYRMISWSEDGVVLNWDLQSKQRKSKLKMSRSRKSACRLSDTAVVILSTTPFSQRLYFIDDIDNIDIIKPKVWKHYENNDNKIICFARISDSKLALGRNDGFINIGSYEQFDEGTIIAFCAHSDSPIIAMCNLPSQQLATSGSADRIVKIWDINTTTCLNQVQVDEPCISLWKCLHHYLVGGTSQQIYVWKTNVVEPECIHFPIRDLSLFYDNQILVTRDHLLEFWSLPDGTCKHSIDMSDYGIIMTKVAAIDKDNLWVEGVYNGEVYACVFSLSSESFFAETKSTISAIACEQYVFILNDVGRVEYFDVLGEIEVFTLVDFDGFLNTERASHYLCRINDSNVAVLQGATVHIIDVIDWHPIRSIFATIDNPSLLSAHVNNTLFIANVDGHIQAWNTSNLKTGDARMDQFEESDHGELFFLDATLNIFVGIDNERYLQVWDLCSGDIIGRYRIDAPSYMIWKETRIGYDGFRVNDLNHCLMARRFYYERSHLSKGIYDQGSLVVQVDQYRLLFMRYNADYS